ncbi:MAG: hypothetical protein ACI30I_07470 [Parabacteroides sp.]
MKTTLLFMTAVLFCTCQDNRPKQDRNYPVCGVANATENLEWLKNRMNESVGSLEKLAWSVYVVHQDGEEYILIENPSLPSYEIYTCGGIRNDSVKITVPMRTWIRINGN